MQTSMLDDYDTHEAMVRWITFHLGKEIYGVEVKQVREILRISNIVPVPGAPDYVLGITNIRGNVVTVIDGRRRLNLSEVEHTDRTRMIVLESGDDIAAVVVDNVEDVIDLPESSFDSNPKLATGKESRYITGVVSYTRGLIIVLSAEKFISDVQYGMAAGF